MAKVEIEAKGKGILGSYHMPCGQAGRQKHKGRRRRSPSTRGRRRNSEISKNLGVDGTYLTPFPCTAFTVDFPFTFKKMKIKNGETLVFRSYNR